MANLNVLLDGPNRLKKHNKILLIGLENPASNRIFYEIIHIRKVINAEGQL